MLFWLVAEQAHDGGCARRSILILDFIIFFAIDRILSLGRLYTVITKNENQELQSILDEDNTRSHLRSADGRGPLFWAHEANNEEAIEMLKKAGASEDWQDADGKTCTTIEHGQMTEYMVCVCLPHLFYSSARTLECRKLCSQVCS
jgi:hypothetical protein